MNYLVILKSFEFMPNELFQIIELSLVLVSLYGFIFYLLISSEDKNSLQKQK